MMFTATAIYTCIMILNASALKSEDITEDIANDVKPACQTIPHADSEPLDTVNDVKSACQTISCVYSGSLTVFIGNLKCNMNKEELFVLLKHFKKFGKVIDLSIPPNALDKTKNEEHCLVTYADAKIANKILNAEHVVDGRTLHVQLHDRTELNAPDTLCMVFVEKLDHDMKREELLDYFGKINRLSMPLDVKDETKNLGYCFITYNERKVANKVLETKHLFKGRTLHAKPNSKNKSWIYNTPRTIFIGNLNRYIGEDEDIEAF